MPRGSNAPFSANDMPKAARDKKSTNVDKVYVIDKE